MLASLLCSRSAPANGRFPASSAVVLAPADPNLVLASATFGLLVSRDAGRTWAWVCEKSVGFVGVEDPAYVIGGDGSIAAGTFQGVHISRDLGCSWSIAPSVGDRVVVDLAARPGNAQDFVVLASAFDHMSDAADLLFRSTLFESTDGGRTFIVLGKDLDPTLLSYSVELATSDPKRMYVSAASGVGTAPVGALLFSTDHGKTFGRTNIPLLGSERQPYIAGVDARDANRVYLRTSNAPDAPTRVLVSDDGGKSFRTVLTSKGALLGFALSPDGSKVYAGGPRDGLLVARTDDFAFRKTSGVQVQCLTATKDLIWVCSNEASGFVLATSTDEGEHFDGKLHLEDLSGPLVCPESSTTTRECPKDWPETRRLLGARKETPDARPVAEPVATKVGLEARPQGSGRLFIIAIAAVAAIGIAALGLRRVWRKR